MEFYILDEAFDREEVVDKYESAIWAERYSKAGDFTLVVPATPEIIELLAPAKFISEASSPEVMQIETHDIDGGTLTVKGRTLETFFDERYIRTSNTESSWELTGKPGEILGQMVQELLVDGPYVNDDGLHIGGILNRIPGLTVGDLDTTGEDVTESFSFGKMYEPMENFAVKHNIGQSLHFTVLDGFDPELVYTTYTGEDRTSEQDFWDVVQFSSALDSLIGVKELSSITSYKTVVYAFPPSFAPSQPVLEVFAPGMEEAYGFERRVLIINCDDITETMVTPTSTLVSLMTKRAQDALANNNFTKIIDGEIVPQHQYKYREDYFLGDKIELLGRSGKPQVAIITEYIASDDASGEKAYPTVSVVDASASSV